MSSIWDRPEPGSRRPRHTREQIAAAALAIADREGFEAVSMRRVAAEVGAGTMTLYHYVRTKDDLIDLMDDAIMGEVLIPDGELPATWREAMRDDRAPVARGVPAPPVGAAGDERLARRPERHAPLRAVARGRRVARRSTRARSSS